MKLIFSDRRILLGLEFLILKQCQLKSLTIFLFGQVAEFFYCLAIDETVSSSLQAFIRSIVHPELYFQGFEPTSFI